MSEYIDKQIIVQDVHDGPFASRSLVETRYDSITSERRGMSGVAVAAFVVAGVTAVVLVSMIVNSQQRTSDEALAQERARTAEAQQSLAQQRQHPAVLVNMTPSQPATVAMPYPVGPAQTAPMFARPAPSNASVEIDITSRLQNDELLRPYAINVKVSGGNATLSGNVPDEGLKKRAETLASAVKPVQSVVNDIAVKP